MNTIDKLFAVQVQRHPDRIAVKDGRRSLTYNQLDKITNQYAHYLKAQGVELETPVAIIMTRSIDVLIAMLAVIKAGGAYVPLDEAAPVKRLLLILKNCPYLITTSNKLNNFKDYSGQKLSIDAQFETRHYPIRSLNKSLDGNNLAYVIYTSGSTGVPKGVMIEHHTVINFSQYFGKFCADSAVTTVDFTSNYAFDMAITNTITALILGLTIVIAADAVKLDANRYFEFLNRHKIELIKVTPSYFKVLLAAAALSETKLDHLKMIVLGGENFTTLDAASWQHLFPHHRLINEYGPTETTVAVSYYQFDNANQFACRPNVPIGKPSSHAKFVIQSRAPEEGVGELLIGGECLARGYLNDTLATTKQFIVINGERFYKTGDLCQQLPDNQYDYLGRIDQQVKIRGFRIELGEIESVLNKNPAVQQAVVITDESADEEKKIIAYVVPNLNCQVISTDLKHYLKQFLIDAMIPTWIIAIKALPLTANGKLDKAALPKPAQPLNSAQQFKGKYEQLLAPIWRQELNYPIINRRDNFFDLGGHSLIAARIITQIKNQFKKEISINDITKAPTIELLAKRIKRAKALKIVDTAVTSNRPYAISDFQLIIWLSHLFDKKVKKINVVTCVRFTAYFDRIRFNEAIEKLLQTYPVLSSKIHRFRPLQSSCATKKTTAIIQDLSLLLAGEVEVNLSDSVSQLQQLPWPSNQPLIAFRLFKLPKQEFELQIALPHIISDGATGAIIVNQLSKTYEHLAHAEPLNTYQDDSFKRYALNEQLVANEHGKDDSIFWQSYLSSAQLVYFDEQWIVRNQPHFNYSSYIAITDNVMANLEHLIQHQHLNSNALLSAATLLALRTHTKPVKKQHHLLVNLVKSTRNNPLYDGAVGCFLRVEPIKIKASAKATLASLTKKIQQEISLTEPYQQALGIIKLASINMGNISRNWRYRLLKPLLSLYVSTFKRQKLSASLAQAAAKLAIFDRQDGFMININLWSNFFHPLKNSDTVKPFGGTPVVRPLNEEELLNIDFVFDVCFLRDDLQRPYLVISANLLPHLRHKIGMEILEQLTRKISILT